MCRCFTGYFKRKCSNKDLLTWIMPSTGLSVTLSWNWHALSFDATYGSNNSPGHVARCSLWEGWTRETGGMRTNRVLKKLGVTKSGHWAGTWSQRYQQDMLYSAVPSPDLSLTLLAMFLTLPSPGSETQSSPSTGEKTLAWSDQGARLEGFLALSVHGQRQAACMDWRQPENWFPQMVEAGVYHCWWDLCLSECVFSKKIQQNDRDRWTLSVSTKRSDRMLTDEHGYSIGYMGKLTLIFGFSKRAQWNQFIVNSISQNSNNESKFIIMLEGCLEM